MRTWREALVDETCGRCGRRIFGRRGNVGRPGEVLLDITVGQAHKFRCKDCGEQLFGEAAPTIPEAPIGDATGALAGLRYQPSLELPPAAPSFVSPGELARRRIARQHEERRRA